MLRKASIPGAGSVVDFAPFGKVKYFYGDDPRERRCVDTRKEKGAYLLSEPDAEGKRHLGISWEDPRDVYSVAVTYAPGEMPDPNCVEVQYWHRQWPYADRDLDRGAFRGWIGRDDHYRGEWIAAISEMDVQGSRVVYDFCHLDVTEMWDPHALERAEDFNAEFRCALKFRLLFPEGTNPRIEKIEAFGKDKWQEGEVDIFGVGECEVEAYNGYVTGVSSNNDALKVRYLYIPTPPDDFPHRRTVITVLDKEKPFSFCPCDLSSGPIYIEDFGILVRPVGDDRSAEQLADQLMQSGVPTIYERVFDEPEQTFERAMAEIPRLRAPFQIRPRGRYVPLGCEGSRQRFGLRYNGSIFTDKLESKVMGRDTAHLLWSGSSMNYKFATGDWPDFRERENACRQSWSKDGAPVITSVWIDRDIEYTQTAFAAYLREDMGEYFGKRGDEDIVLLVQFEIRAISSDGGRAHLWLQSSPYECMDYANSILSAHGRLIKTERIDSDEIACRADTREAPQSFNWTVRQYDKPLTRCRIDLGKGCGFTTPLALDKEGPAGVATAFHYWADLKGGERDVITFVLPYCTVTADEDLLNLGSIDYNAKLRDVREFWLPFVDSGMQINIPDKMIESFYRNVPVHVAMTATKDPESGNYTVPAATLLYGACGNEAVIQIKQLDYRGMHRQAEKYLDGLLLVQGSCLLDGNFRSKEGALAGIAFYNGKALGTPFSYNTDHGFILWSLSEHYFITRDKGWLKRVAMNIIAGCDFVTRERQATKIEEGSERVREYGLLPAGHLEDNDDWRHWFAVNGHAYLGIKWAAQALAEIDHPEAARLTEDAQDYLQDILSALERAQVESPVVRLPDNTSIPHLPIRTEIRGPEWGWIREGAYGPMHLVDSEVLEPNDQRVTWLMKYLEDLIYPTRNFGRPVDMEKRWFSQAGLTIQANLLNNGVAYVRRDEPKHAVRALFNDFAASIYDDVLVFTEHPVPGLARGAGPYYKTPDECGFLNLLRCCMVIEEGDTLYLAKAAPVSWFRVGETVELTDGATWFGPVSYSICVGTDTMEATVKPPRRNPPAKLAMRLRRADGKAIKEVTVNGKHGEWDAEKELLWLDAGAEKLHVVAE